MNDLLSPSFFIFTSFSIILTYCQILSILRDNGIEPMIVDVDEKSTDVMVKEIDVKIQGKRG